jgi:type IV pilus assembly protein PilC
MSIFEYKTRNRDGEEKIGKMEATDRAELARTLRSQGNIILSIHEVKEGTYHGLFKHLTSFFNRVSLKEKIIFANNLSAMISAGLTLSRSLEVIKKQSKNPKLHDVVGSLSEDISKGKSFSDSLSKFSNVFPPIFIAMVRAGEESGEVPEALKLISEQMMKTYELRRKIRSAMIYPIIVIIVIIAIATLMMIYLVPTLSATFKDLGAELPITTRIVIAASDILVNYILLVGIIFFLFIIFVWRFAKTQKGKRTFSFLFLHLPIISGITIKSNAALTMRTISSLISSGVGLLQSLEITASVLQNTYYVHVLNEAKKEVQKGTTLASIFSKYEGVYPPLVNEMIQVGEETGKLGEMLLKGAVFFEDEVDSITKNLSTIIEPLLMVFVGAAVGFFALSMIQPIYSLGDIL